MPEAEWDGLRQGESREDKTKVSVQVEFRDSLQCHQQQTGESACPGIEGHGYLFLGKLRGMSSRGYDLKATISYMPQKSPKFKYDFQTENNPHGCFGLFHIHLMWNKNTQSPLQIDI